MSDTGGTSGVQAGSTGPSGATALNPAPAKNSGSDTGSPPHASGAGVSDALGVIAAKKRGRPLGSTKTGTTPAASVEELARLKQQSDMIAQLFTPENFKALVELPGDVGYALTGHEFWQLTDAESKTLSSTSAAAAKVFNVSPVALAIFMLASSLASIYGARVVKEVAVRKAAKKNKPPEPVKDKE